MRINTDRLTGETAAFRLLCGAAFSAVISLPLARGLIALCVLVVVIDCIRRRRPPAFPLVAQCWIAFFAVAIFASATGVDPLRSFHKLDKLLWFLTIPLTATLVQEWDRVRKVLTAIVAGAAILALEVLVWRPIMAARCVREITATGQSADYLWEIINLGSMTDGQMYLLAVVACTGLICWRGAQHHLPLKQGALFATLMTVLVAALIVNFKRGSIICTFLSVGLFVATRLKLRHLLLFGILAISVLSLPPVWQRFAHLRVEMDATHGGRMVMWTQIAPPLIREHPFGIGFRALTSDLMQAVAQEQGVYVEPGRNHLHSNVVQTLVSTGWLGLSVYTFWMGAALANCLFLVRRTLKHSPERALALSLLLMLTGLILNGLIEYNFADGELVLLYGIIMGMATAKQGTSNQTMGSA